MSNNPLSNISYTNKDFTSIYTELLDLVKKLTYKWDPSISNESDPGNVLLKLNAIIGDKNNYNTDKNILENFPETLTQDISARSLYKQLAYRMPWYKSAITDITFKWCGKDDKELTSTSGIVKVDKFQMVTDPNTEFVYTTLGELSFKHDVLTQTVKAIEGTINTMIINGTDIIELTNLDDNNRLYFDESNVAENGIFIYNIDNPQNYWQMVDNLQVEALGNTFYEFGIDSRKNLCYIEFPDDIHNLIGSGIKIQYIVTNGYNGNIIAKTLDRFYEDVSVDFNGDKLLLDESVLQMSNFSGTNNGSDPEDIPTAYKHYRRTAGTFDTLVTVRDYMNAIYNSGMVSNVRVCDRLEDVQSTYNIVTDDNYINKTITQIACTEKSSYIGFTKVGSVYDSRPEYKSNTYYNFNASKVLVPINTETQFNNIADWQNIYFISDDLKEDMQAFDLRMYVLHNPGVVGTYDDYTKSFQLEPSGGTVEQNIIGYLSDINCVQHDFQPILPNVPCLFKNSFPLDIKIIPHYRLDDDQITDLKVTINKALFKLLNSNQLSYGVEPDYNVIYDTILASDERIKVLILDDFVYTTFATYWDNIDKKFKDIPISAFETNSNIVKINNSNDININKLSEYEITNNYFITPDNKVYKIIDNKVVEYSTKINDFRRDIIAKSVLAGKSTLYNQDNLFRYTVDQETVALKQTDRITTNIEISPLGFNGNKIPVIKGQEVRTLGTSEYTLRANETVRFLAPSLRTSASYSNYVKFELILNEDRAKETIKSIPYSDYLNEPTILNTLPVTLDYVYENNNKTYTLSESNISWFKIREYIFNNNYRYKDQFVKRKWTCKADFSNTNTGENFGHFAHLTPISIKTEDPVTGEIVPGYYESKI